jgi:hypothetical protein
LFQFPAVTRKPSPARWSRVSKSVVSGEEGRVTFLETRQALSPPPLPPPLEDDVDDEDADAAAVLSGEHPALAAATSPRKTSVPVKEP